MFSFSVTAIAALRTLTYNQNFDLLECGQRLSHATHLNQIYERHPDWKKKAKRLEGSLDEMNPTSWTGSVEVADVDVEQCWFDRRMKCIDALSTSGLFGIGDLILLNLPRKDTRCVVRMVFGLV